jgi:hypothetical protein
MAGLNALQRLGKSLFDFAAVQNSNQRNEEILPFNLPRFFRSLLYGKSSIPDINMSIHIYNNDSITI